MKKLLNTLYVLTPDSYLFCRNENICVRIGDMEKLSVPALNIDSIVCFGKMTVSTPLLEFCGSHGISLTFIRENGRFTGQTSRPSERKCSPSQAAVCLHGGCGFRAENRAVHFAGKVAKQ